MRYSPYIFLLRNNGTNVGYAPVRTLKKEQILRFPETISRSKDPITEYEEDLRNTTVKRMTVYSYKKAIFAFRDGTIVKWKIEQ